MARHRFLDTENLVPIRRRRVVATAVRARRGGEDAAMAEPLVEALVFRRPVDIVPRDWGVYLLRRAAQVEHSLMVQYLFTLYSLKPGLAVGSSSTDDWRDILKQVATEEMGHFLTVQNLLRLIGGPLSFDREEFPTTSELYPFPFQLERLTKDSLAKYVFAEMSEKPLPGGVISESKRREIEERARHAAQVSTGAFINHVGTLYETLLYVFDQELGDEDFRTDRKDWLAGASQFRLTNEATVASDGTPHLEGIKALAPQNRLDAIVALRIVGQQGEAADEPQEGIESHFERFLAMYDQCPDDTAALTYPVATNPNTRVTGADTGTIAAGKARLWAQLFNVRYRIVLTNLAHALTMPSVHQGVPTARRTLIRWIYEDMADTPSALRALADHLMELKLADGAAENAGPPFELPYSLALPDQPPERWRLHLDLLAGSQALVKELQRAGETAVILVNLENRDASRGTKIATDLQNSGF